MDQFLEEASNEKSIEDIKIKINRLQKQHEEIDSEIANYVILFGKGKIKESMFDELTRPLELNKEHVENELEILQSQLNANKKVEDRNEQTIKYMNSFAEMVDKDLSMSEKRNFLDFFIEKVTLYDDDHMEVVWKNKTLNEDRSQTVDFTEGETEEASDNQHKRLNRIQAYGRQTA